MAEQLPINPAILAWARERAGLSFDEVVQKYSRLGEWETGDSAPTYPQLESIADTFKVPLAVFFFPEPPDVPSINETFRTLPETELDSLPSRLRLLMRNAKAMQLNLHELTQGKNPADSIIIKDLSFEPTVDLSVMVAQVRNYLGVSIEDQFEWDSPDTALKEWRSCLRNVGIFVFKDAFKDNDYSGFCLYDQEFPIIYVNNSSSKTRQIFTYFHELAHLIFHTSGIDKVRDGYINRLTGNERQIETLCNSFASNFLVPRDTFEAVSSGLDPTEENTKKLASKFNVSREVIFRLFLDHGKINQQQYEQSVANWNDQQQSGSGRNGGNHYWTKLAYLGRDYVALALSQYHQNRIDESQLAEFLDTKAKNLSTLEDYFYRSSA